MEQYKYVATLSSKVKYFNKLYLYGAMLENAGWNCLVPIDLSKYLGDPIFTEALSARHNLSLLDIHKQKIDMSDALVVYFDREDSLDDYKYSDTIRELKYAMSKNKDIYISRDPSNTINGRDWVYIEAFNAEVKFEMNKVLTRPTQSKDRSYLNIFLYKLKYRLNN